MLDAIKNLANKQDVPYQSLIKVFLAERIEGELHKRLEPRPTVRRPRSRASKPTRAFGSRG
jgi:hypothetical protein